MKKITVEDIDLDILTLNQLTALKQIRFKLQLYVQAAECRLKEKELIKAHTDWTCGTCGSTNTCTCNSN